MKEVIRDKPHAFEVWDREKARFVSLFGSLSPKQLEQQAVTSGCGHTVGQHIACVLVWMEESLSYLRRSKEDPGAPELEIESVVDYTNKLLEEYRGATYSTIWNSLGSVEDQYKRHIAQWDEEMLFGNEDLWEWFVWSTFGHYDEHSTELEWQLAGSVDVPPDKEWTNGYLKNDE